MKKQHLVDLVAERMNVTTTQALRFLDAFVGILRQEQTSATGIAVEGFGTFRCLEPAARMRASAATDGSDGAAPPKTIRRTTGSLRGVDAERTTGKVAPSMSLVEPARRPGHAVPVPPLARGLNPGQSGELRAAGMRDMVEVLRASARLERGTPKRRA